MRNLILFRLAAQNIRLNWRHSFATMMAILLGFVAVAMLEGFTSGLYNFIEESYVNKGMIGHVIIEKEGTNAHFFEDPWLYTLSEEEQLKIHSWLASDTRIQAYSKYLVISGLLSNGKSNAVFVAGGIETDKGLQMRGEKWAWNTLAGKPLHLTSEDSMLLGRGMAQIMKCHFDEAVPFQRKDGGYHPEERGFSCDYPNFQLSVTTETARVNAVDLPASGILDFNVREFNDKIIMLPFEVVQRLGDTKRATRFQVLLRDKSQIASFISDMNVKFREAGIQLETVKWLDYNAAAASKGGLEILRVFRALFLSIISLIAAMTVANSMMKSVNERIREIGALRSFGFRQKDIALLFSFEGLLLSFSSCLLGMIFSLALALIIQALGLSFDSGTTSTPIPVRISIALVPWLTTTCALSAIGFFAAWVVAFRASRMSIAEALRHVA
ncbi:MAG: ABC transporter permease [Bdellovibrionota bacterium]